MARVETQTMMLGRTAAFVLGLIIIYLGVPFAFALADRDESGAVGLVQVILIVIWITGFVVYIARNYRHRYRPDLDQ